MFHCKVLHVVPHLGGGVGRCLSSLFDISSRHIYREVLLLEAPIDRQYENIISNLCKISVVDWSNDLSSHISQFDLVQIEFWNHPATLHFLYATQYYLFRRIFWCHISGKGNIKLPVNFLHSTETIVFTSNQSNFTYGLRRPVINSGYGFSRSTASLPPHSDRKFDFVFAGQLDFRKMHRDLIDILNAAASLTKNPFYILGEGKDSDFIQKGVTSSNLKFLGHVNKIDKYLENTKFLIYPLTETHYGTGENIIKEAMSLACIPILLDNDVELEITKHFASNLCFSSVLKMKEQLLDLVRLENAAKYSDLSTELKLFCDHEYSASLSAQLFEALYRNIKNSDKTIFRMTDFFGATVYDWYNAFNEEKGENIEIEGNVERSSSKGSLKHFCDYFRETVQLKGP